MPAFGKRGYEHFAVAECGDPEVAEAYLPIIHLVFANLKTWLIGIHHGCQPKAASGYPMSSRLRALPHRWPFNAFRSGLPAKSWRCQGKTWTSPSSALIYHRPINSNFVLKIDRSCSGPPSPRHFDYSQFCVQGNRLRLERDKLRTVLSPMLHSKCGGSYGPSPPGVDHRISQIDDDF